MRRAVFASHRTATSGCAIAIATGIALTHLWQTTVGEGNHLPSPAVAYPKTKSSKLKDLPRKKKIKILWVHRYIRPDTPGYELMLYIMGKRFSANVLAEQYGFPVIVSTHPRTQKRLDSLGYDNKTGFVQFLKPFGFSDCNRLQRSSFCTVSDSGTISEESAMLEFPAVTIRNARSTGLRMHHNDGYGSGSNYRLRRSGHPAVCRWGAD